MGFQLVSESVILNDFVTAYSPLYCVHSPNPTRTISLDAELSEHLVLILFLVAITWKQKNDACEHSIRLDKKACLKAMSLVQTNHKHKKYNTAFPKTFPKCLHYMCRNAIPLSQFSACCNQLPPSILMAFCISTVSYTHLTLPTKRIV